VDLFSFISLLGIVGGCSLRSRILQIAAAGGQVSFSPDPTELADYVLVYAIRGPGLATRVTYQLTAPPVGGIYGIADDNYPVALGGSKDTGLGILFTNNDPANALAIEVYFARFSQANLDDLRCLVGFASPAAAALLTRQLEKEGITA
jgi:hypothetical protein